MAVLCYSFHTGWKHNRHPLTFGFCLQCECVQSVFSPLLSDSSEVTGVYWLQLQSAVMKAQHQGVCANFGPLSSATFWYVLLRQLAWWHLTIRLCSSRTQTLFSQFEGETEVKDILKRTNVSGQGLPAGWSFLRMCNSQQRYERSRMSHPLATSIIGYRENAVSS